jgi:hypothetical protein
MMMPRCPRKGTMCSTPFISNRFVGSGSRTPACKVPMIVLACVAFCCAPRYQATGPGGGFR